MVTGEAVALELRVARLASRSLAVAIDLALQVLALLMVSVVVGGAIGFSDSALQAALTLVSVLAVVLGYPVIWETLTRGRTPGKMALGLRVVREDGGPVRFRQSFVRGLLAVVEIWLSAGTVALISSLASTQGRRVGDHLAGTLVIHERVPVRAATMVSMPLGLERWAASLDLTRLPDDLALAARQFLGRVHDLAPQVQIEMGTSLARSVAAVTTPPPPAGVPAWAFLSAVLAERRRRDLLRAGTPPWFAQVSHPAPALPVRMPPPTPPPAPAPMSAWTPAPHLAPQPSEPPAPSRPAAAPPAARPDETPPPFAPPG